jgi:hypothetical protein
MKREPSVHIKKSDLVLVLNKIFVKNEVLEWDVNELADLILIGSKQYSLTNRQLKVDTAKLLKSTSKVVLSTRDDAGVFAQLLNLIRKQRNHRGISLIKVGSNDWNMVKEIAHLAVGFCNDFHLKREEGFKIYIGIALDKISKFSLAKFNTFHQGICDDYDCIEKIRTDLTPNQTTQVRIIYEKYLGEKTGIVKDYTKIPNKFIFFIKAKEQALKFRISFDHYIAAQFKGLEWCNSYPDPSQLVGDGSIDRLNKYLLEKGIKPGALDQVKKAEEVGKWLREKMSKNKRK